MGQSCLAFGPPSMESPVCLCPSLPCCSWVDCLHLLSMLYQRDSICCNEAFRSDKLRDRLISLLESDSTFVVIRWYLSLPSPLTHNLYHVGINPYVIALTALAAGTSWPDLWASKIAAERQTTADSAIANITCRCNLTCYSYYVMNLCF